MENLENEQSKEKEESIKQNIDIESTSPTQLEESGKKVDEPVELIEEKVVVPINVNSESISKKTATDNDTSLPQSDFTEKPQPDVDGPNPPEGSKNPRKSMEIQALSDEKKPQMDEGVDEKENANNSTDESQHEEAPHLDYTNYTKKQMVHVLESMLKEDDFSQVSKILKEIKRPYDKIANAERKEAYKKFIGDGGEKDGFEYRLDELDQSFLSIYKKLKERKNQFYNTIEKQKENNLNIKLELLEHLRELVDSEETGISIKSLKEIQEKWKAVGVIPSAQAKGLWANYNALLDRFYDQRSIYFELKELDRKKNYDLKIELCEKAEQLLKGENLHEAIKLLNEYHEEFKHVGPVPKEDQEAVWARFKAASDEIYSLRKVFYDQLKDEHKLNETAKEALIEKVLPFGEFNSDKISDWNKKTKEILAIQKEWDSIGNISKEKAKIINRNFWAAFKSFFNNKGQFFKKVEKNRDANLILKMELVKRAEALKDSEDFHSTTDELKELQRKWKDIGPVPERKRNEVFFQFKKACDHFFDKRRKNNSKLDKDYIKNLEQKETLCGELEHMVKSGKIDLNRVKSIESEWGEIGYVPKENIRSIQNRYMEVVGQITDKVDLPEAEKLKLKYAAQFNKMNYGPGAEKLLQRKEGALRRQISSLENEISLWKNNIDFFASSKSADKLKRDFELKIDKASKQVESLKEQLRVISNI